MRRPTFFFTLQLLFCINLFGQSKLTGFSSDDTFQGYINEMTPMSDGRLVASKQINQKPEGIVTDQFGNELSRKPLTIPQGEVLTNSYIFEYGDKYVFMGNLRIQGRRYFGTYSVDSKLSNPILLDTILLDTTSIYVNSAKWNSVKERWETIGIIQRASTPFKILDNIALALDQNFNFVQVKYLKDEEPDHVLDFYWDIQSDIYIVNSFSYSDGFVILDSAFNLVRKQTFSFTFEHDGINYLNYNIKPYNCVGAGGSNILCYCEVLGNSPYRNLFVTFSVDQDSLFLLKMQGLDSISTFVNVAKQMRTDQLGNVYISGVNRFSNSPNSIRVVKYSPDLKRIAEFTYTDSVRIFLIWDMDLLPDQSIAIVGAVQNMFAQGDSRGFILTVAANGITTLQDEPEIPDPNIGFLFPNPTTDQFCIKTGVKKVTYVSITDVNGRVVMRNRYANPQDQICETMPIELESGLYFVTISFSDGKIEQHKLVYFP
jgi:Secretion system C-terminal sorting domain